MQHKATIFYEWEQGKSAYSFPFPYLSKQFVKVRVDHANTSTLLEYNRDYTIEGQTLTLTPVQPFVSGATLCIYRQTPTGSLVDFSDGSLLLASEMDRLSTQLLHVEEENSDLIASTGMFADDENSWQGQGRRIKNLSDPVDTHDAVTLSHLDKVGVARREEIAALAVRAESATETANEHAAAASVSKDDAQTAKQGAETARDAAKGYAEDAKNSAEKAKKSADDSMAVVENIQTREANVLRAETYVKSYAQRVDQQAQWVGGKEVEINGYANTASEAAIAAAKSAQTAADNAKNADVSNKAANSDMKATEKFAQEAAASAQEAAKSAQESADKAKISGVIDTAHIMKEAITTEKLALGSVTWEKLATEIGWSINRGFGRDLPKLVSIMDKDHSSPAGSYKTIPLYQDVLIKTENTENTSVGQFDQLVIVCCITPPVSSGAEKYFSYILIPSWEIEYCPSVTALTDGFLTLSYPAPCSAWVTLKTKPSVNWSPPWLISLSVSNAETLLIADVMTTNYYREPIV